MLKRLSVRLWAEGIWTRVAVVLVVITLLEISPIPLTLTEAITGAREQTAIGEYRTAASNYHLAYSYQPWCVEHLSAAAYAELRFGDHMAAERDLDVLATRRPLRAEEVLWLGAIYAGQGRVDEAVGAWENAHAQGAVDADSLARLVDIYLTRHNWSRAINALQGLAERAPDDPLIHYRLGVLQALDAPWDAQVNLARAAGLDPSYATVLAPLQSALDGRENQPPDLAYARLGTLYIGLSEWHLAEEALSRAVALNPAYGEALAYLAYVDSRLDKPALGAVQQAVALSPESPTVHYLAGLVWKQLERWPEARTEFEKAYDLDPVNPAFAVEIAETHRAEAAPQWAEVWLQEAVRLAPDDIRFQILLVQFYVDDEYRVSEVGLPLAEELVDRWPDNAAAHDALGWAYFLTRDQARAQTELNLALRFDPTLARAHVHLAVLLETLGRTIEALGHYRIAVELEPDGLYGAYARRALERLGVPS